MASEQEAEVARARARARQRMTQQAERPSLVEALPGIVGNAVVDAAGQTATRVDDIMRSLASGATFGYADELAAAANAATGLGQGGYEENLAAERARDKSIPLGVSLPGEIAGGLATTAIAAPIAGATKVGQAVANLPNFVKALGAGGLFGGLYGSGAAEEDRLSGAATGAGLGAATGGVLYPVAKGIGAGVQGISNIIENRAAPISAANRRILQAMQRDTTAPQKVQARLRTLGPQGTIADAGGENLLGLGRTVAGTPGAPKNRAAMTLNQRAESEATRIGQRINTTLKPKDYYAAEDQFIANLRENAADLYQNAYRAGPRLESKKLSRLLERPVVKDAMAEAADLAAIEGRRVSRLDPELTAQANALISSGRLARSDIPKGGIGRGVTTEAIDDLKRGLDVLIERNTNELTGRLDKRGAALAQLKREILNEADALNPAYAKARAQYGGDAEVVQALREGRKFNRLDPEQITRQMQGMSEAAKDAYRSGVARAMKDIVDNTPDTTNAANRLFSKSIMRDRLKAAFPSEQAFNDLARTLQAERLFARTRNTVLGGSQTAPRQAEQADLAGPLIGAVDVATGTGGGLSSTLRGLMNRATAPNPAVAQQISGALFNRNQAMNQRVLEGLMNRAQGNQATAAVNNNLLQTLNRIQAQQGGGAIGGQF